MCDWKVQGHSHHLAFFWWAEVLCCHVGPCHHISKNAVFHVRILLIHSQAWPLSVRDIIANQLGKYLKLPVYTVISKLTLSF
jgi:hypothetical protein